MCNDIKVKRMSIKKYLTSAVALAMVGMASLVNAGEITHELGVTNVPDAPKRIIVLEFSFIDALASVGVSPVGIADDKKRDRVIPAYTDVIGNEWVSVGTRKTPSLEIMASLNPDLIIADKTRHSAVYAALSEIAPTIVLDSLSGNYPESVEQMSIIGKAIGKSEQMEARVAAHKATMKDYIAQMKNTGNYVAQFGVTNKTGLWLHSPVSYNGSLLELFGFKSNMLKTNGDTYDENYVKTSLEQLSVVNPDILILGKYVDPAHTDSWAEEPLFKQLTAVKNGNVYNITAHNWSRLRGMLAAELTAADLLEIMKKVK